MSQACQTQVNALKSHCVSTRLTRAILRRLGSPPSSFPPSCVSIRMSSKLKSAMMGEPLFEDPPNICALERLPSGGELKPFAPSCCKGGGDGMLRVYNFGWKYAVFRRSEIRSVLRQMLICRLLALRRGSEMPSSAELQHRYVRMTGPEVSESHQAQPGCKVNVADDSRQQSHELREEKRGNARRGAPGSRISRQITAKAWWYHLRRFGELALGASTELANVVCQQRYPLGLSHRDEPPIIPASA